MKLVQIFITAKSRELDISSNLFYFSQFFLSYIAFSFSCLFFLLTPNQQMLETFEFQIGEPHLQIYYI